MANVLWLNWSGGGNLPPSLGIAQALADRGHDVAFAGRPEMVERVQRAGFRAIELTRAYEQVGEYPDKWLPHAASFLTSPAVAEQVRDVVADESPDLVVIDAMFPAALTQADDFDCPTVVMSHTAVNRLMDAWEGVVGMVLDLRTEAGFPPIAPDLDALWMSCDRLLVSTLASLDDAPPRLADAHKIRHVGPVLEQERHGAVVELPWEEDGSPLVLVSFSTMPEQGSVEKFQTAVDALAQLPVRGVVTVGDSVDPDQVEPTDRVVVFATADHNDLMRRASLVLTHGGHGTLMRALTNGLPMVVIPGLAHDQAPNGAAVEVWGVGRALPPEVDVETLRSTISTVLDDSSYRDAARQIAGELADADGARAAADEIEQLIGL